MSLLLVLSPFIVALSSSDIKDRMSVNGACSFSNFPRCYAYIDSQENFKIKHLGLSVKQITCEKTVKDANRGQRVVLYPKQYYSHTTKGMGCYLVSSKI